MNTELQTIPGSHGDYTYGRDDYGEFGSLLRPESDDAIPEPDRSTRSPIEDKLNSLLS